jgi:hypothetical protein
MYTICATPIEVVQIPCSGNLLDDIMAIRGIVRGFNQVAVHGSPSNYSKGPSPSLLRKKAGLNGKAVTFLYNVTANILFIILYPTWIGTYPENY